ncbi:hypothetical protein GCM10010990_01520 [Croceicoccus mobilis]|uniref:N-end rule aminoacyl transferase C-terminal domain-containing protein n=1 Tax=Croceicoccus mobilis TaxID=1703339 RepID=A0A917DNM1_9SPHN|nr:hypothetical protein GCM10010990_01520 [Croceicoccus mobilis]
MRVVASEFAPSRTQSRTMSKNSDLIATACRPWSTVEQYELLQKYLKARHPGGGMSAMDSMDYADMIEQTPVTSYVVEYREPGENGEPGRLIGACLTDRQNDGLSMIYSFYDPDHSGRSGLGNYIILDHIDRAAKAGLPYVYLGYWIEGSSRMQYKVRYRPLERLGREGWERFDAGRQDSLIAGMASDNRPDGKGDSSLGANKDGVPGGQDQYRILEN